MIRNRIALAVIVLTSGGLLLWAFGTLSWKTDGEEPVADVEARRVPESEPAAEGSRRGRLTKQAEIVKTAIQANRSSKGTEEDKPNPWRHVPGELDELLMSEPEDIEATAVFRVEVETFLVNAELDGTSVVETRCGRSICRARLVHTTEDDYLKYYRHYGLSPWAARSNYFSAQPGGDGAWGSYAWAGVAGYELPLKEIHDRHEFLGD